MSVQFVRWMWACVFDFARGENRPEGETATALTSLSARPGTPIRVYQYVHSHCDTLPYPHFSVSVARRCASAHTWPASPQMHPQA